MSGGATLIVSGDSLNAQKEKSMKKSAEGLKKWNHEQIKISQSEMNKVAFYLKYKREGDNHELLQFYIESGQAKRFSELNERDYL